MKNLLLILLGVILFSCDQKGKDAEKVISDLERMGMKGEISSIEEIPYKTDSTGKIGDMDSCCITLDSFDERGMQVASRDMYSKGDVKSETSVERHPNGLWKGMSYTEGGKLKNRFDTKLDEEGNYVWAQAYDSANNPDVYYTGISQNDYGAVTAWKQYDKDSVFRQSGESTYDGVRLVASTVKDSLGNLKSAAKMVYDEKGFLVESANTSYKPDTTETKVKKYTYEEVDEKGNWIQRTTWDENGKATKIDRRNITYRKND